MNDYNYILFDVDGTLLDTRELIFRSFEHIVGVYSGRPLSRETVFYDMGMMLPDQLEKYLGPCKDGGTQEIVDMYKTYQRSIFTDYLKAFPGIPEMLEALVSAGKTLGIVTSRQSDSLLPYLSNLGIMDFFSCFITPDITKANKPDAEPLLEALKRLNAPKEKSLFVGDASFDIECGYNAGVATCFAGWSGKDPERLLMTPTYIFYDVKELLEIVTKEQKA